MDCVIKIARRTVLVTSDENHLVGLLRERAGYDPTRSSRVFAAVNTIEPIICGGRTNAESVRMGPAGFPSA